MKILAYVLRNHLWYFIRRCSLESRLGIALARVPSRTSLRLMAKKGDGTHVNARTTEKDYTLDRTKALEKKVEACDRNTVSFLMKPCRNFDATLNTSAYELYRQISEKKTIHYIFATNWEKQMCCTVATNTDAKDAIISHVYQLSNRKTDGTAGKQVKC